MDDLISRQAAIDALKVAYWDNDIQAAKDDPCVIDAMTDWAIRQIKALPSAERHGRWINCGWSIKCSICDYDMPFSVRNYCPNCGSRMDLGEETK